MTDIKKPSQNGEQIGSSGRNRSASRTGNNCKNRGKVEGVHVHVSQAEGREHRTMSPFDTRIKLATEVQSRPEGPPLFRMRRLPSNTGQRQRLPRRTESADSFASSYGPKTVLVVDGDDELRRMQDEYYMRMNMECQKKHGFSIAAGAFPTSKSVKRKLAVLVRRCAMRGHMQVTSYMYNNGTQLYPDVLGMGCASYRTNFPSP